MNRILKLTLIAGASLIVVSTVIGATPSRRDNPKPPTIEDLSSAEQLRQRLQKDTGKVTLIALLSPVCPACRHGFTDMQTILKNIPDDRLRVHIVWLPNFPGDNKSRAETRTAEFNDSRVSYYWDGDKCTDAEWQKVLGIDKSGGTCISFMGRTLAGMVRRRHQRFGCIS